MKTNYIKPISEIVTDEYESILMLQNSGNQSDDADAKPFVFDEEEDEEETLPWGVVY
mgnify:FL=1|jgi:hypothetical protein